MLTATDKRNLSKSETPIRIPWYRSPVDRDVLTTLNQRSDWKGLLQTFGHLGLLALTGIAAWHASENFSLPVLLLILFIHGTFWAFLLNAFHEFCHKTVFKSKTLNRVFLYFVSLLSWSNPVLFWASHQEHHKYTLHPPEDLEVVLPQELTLESFLKNSVVNPWDFIYRLKTNLRLSFGILESGWVSSLFPPEEIKLRRDLFNWARIHLLGHAIIIAVSLYFDLWIIPIVITLAPFYGGWLQYLCNNTQHAGLMDNVPDFRLCVRTIYLNPFVRFLYWHMNYHIEHHMYAAVPCYNLGKLHEQIKSDLPHCPTSLFGAWKEIIAILKKQKEDPCYQYEAVLPSKDFGNASLGI
jgi:fatty acid desaturase